MSLFDGWGPDDQDQLPLDMKSLSQDELSEVSFLFGGVGDGSCSFSIYISIATTLIMIVSTLARHTFGTIIGANRALKKLEKHRRSSFKVHMTLLDLHPNALARDLCIIMLLDSLMDQNTSQTERLEIKATLFYTYVGIVLPEYCFQRCVQYTHIIVVNKHNEELQIVRHYERPEEAFEKQACELAGLDSRGFDIRTAHNKGARLLAWLGRYERRCWYIEVS